MTDPPVLLPNARHQSAKTGFASLPPRPVNSNTLPPKPAAQHSTIPAESSSITREVWPDRRVTARSATSSIDPLDAIDTGRENRSKSVASPSPSLLSSSAYQRAPVEQAVVTSSPQIATPSSSTLGKRSFDNHGESAESPQDIATSESSEPRIIPILPVPLPSKRFKKGAQARASLVPVEQLPVFPLPPLPVISDPTLEKQVFTHQSCFPRRKWRFEDPEEDPSLDYEKLEHVGDSILGMVVTTWLHELKPRLTCGRASVSSSEPFTGNYLMRRN